VHRPGSYINVIQMTSPSVRGGHHVDGAGGGRVAALAD
jgi:hypothetical protein